MQLSKINQAEAFGQALLERASNEPYGLGLGRIHRQFTLDEASFDILKDWERALSYTVGARLTNSETLRLLLLAVGFPPYATR